MISSILQSSVVPSQLTVKLMKIFQCAADSNNSDDVLSACSMQHSAGYGQAAVHVLTCHILQRAVNQVLMCSIHSQPCRGETTIAACTICLALSGGRLGSHHIMDENVMRTLSTRSCCFPNLQDDGKRFKTVVFCCHLACPGAVIKSTRA